MQKVLMVVVMMMGGMAAGQTLTCNGPVTRCGGCYVNAEEYEHDKAICELGIEIGLAETETHLHPHPEPEPEDVPAIHIPDESHIVYLTNCPPDAFVCNTPLVSQCSNHGQPDLNMQGQESTWPTKCVGGWAWGCADKANILLHDEQENPVWWCHKVKQ